MKNQLFKFCIAGITFLSFGFGELSAQVGFINGVPSSQVMATAAIKSEFIFEGVIIDQIIYEGTPGNAYTANVIHITRIFKGQQDLQCGEVLLIHKGSSGEWVDFGQGMYLGNAPTHSIDFRKDNKGIFFAKKNYNYFPEPPQNNSSQEFILKNVNQGEFTFVSYLYDPRYLQNIDLNAINDFAEGFNGMNFNDYDEVNQYLVDSLQIDSNTFIVCDEIGEGIANPNHQPILIKPNKRKEQPVPIEDDSEIKDYIKEEESNVLMPNNSIDNAERKKKVQFFEESLNERIKNNPPIHLGSRAGEELYYSIENEKFTGTSPRYLEFDIYVAANTSGLYLDNCPIHLSYNTVAFGDSIVANNKINITKGATFNVPSYDDPNSLANDWAQDTIALVLGLKFGLSSYNRVQIPTAPTVLVHVKIEIKECYKQTKINFVNKPVVKNVTYFATNATQPLTGPIYFYDDINFTNNLDIKLCQPVITGFNNNLRAGVGDILIIQGRGFGATRGNGKVLLKNSDDGGIGYRSYIQNMDPLDYISWSDSEIQLEVPSTVAASDGVCSGSGPIIVKTDLGDSAISNLFTIKYALRNTSPVPSYGNQKLRYNMIDINGDGGYTFHCDTSISNYPLRKAIVERALHDWSCRTGVNWKLGNDTILKGLKRDGVSLIYVDDSIEGAPLAGTLVQGLYPCSTAGHGDQAYYEEIDIQFSRTFTEISSLLSWYYDTTGANVPNLKYDFYGILLHELGHAHAIDHVNDTNDVMYYGTTHGLSSSQRNFQTAKWFNTVDAGNDVMTQSENIQWNCNGVNPIISDIPENCSFINYFKEHSVEETGLLVYPNPTNSATYVKFLGMETGSVSVIDSRGRIIFRTFPHDDSPIEIDLNSYEQGMYIINVSSSQFSGSTKIIKN